MATKTTYVNAMSKFEPTEIYKFLHWEGMAYRDKCQWLAYNGVLDQMDEVYGEMSSVEAAAIDMWLDGNKLQRG